MYIKILILKCEIFNDVIVGRFIVYKLVYIIIYYNRNIDWDFRKRIFIN